MNIGQAAKASGVSAKMIRYYEQTGLISAADRKASGYRDYSDEDVHMLRFIRSARDVGFQVAEIQKLLDLWTNRERQSTDVKKIALDHIALLRLKIQELQQMAQTLETLVSKCAGDQRPSCPILEGLENHGADEPIASRKRNSRILPPHKAKHTT
ncbi:Cu(I)-responsive transcriptional regulator [Rhizobium esperanzae]|uniref:MerR family gold-responsive transcriptional activator of gol and ges genes n=1 Tax=Rhizobium esperanzae TaxID=1967781 RepID=A0A7W6W769_9HYPH|nr:Cu(I)-responsive transcriptional regulator [Rhizobium esperanzae]MBB4237930.1 MerR family gold-responsive transcriptional activator of gol and ges genes [Rhizobium esperanzae]